MMMLGQIPSNVSDCRALDILATRFHKSDQGAMHVSSEIIEFDLDLVVNISAVGFLGVEVPHR